MDTNQKLYLFQLIKSLSSSEKGYVKKYCAKNGAGAAYLKLFDAVEKQVVYDEEAIKKRFKKEKFVNQFSVAKNYLIKAILKSLRSYHAESSKNIQVHELLLEIEILHGKRLAGLSQKLLRKAKKIALESELYNHYAEISFWDFRLTLSAEYTDQTDQQMETIKKVGNEGMDSILLLYQYRHLAYDIYKYTLKSGYSREAAALAVAHDFEQHELLQAPPTQSVRALGRYYNIWTKIHEIKNDFEAGYETSRKFVAVIQDNPLIFADFLMSTVVPAHYNLVAICVSLNKKEMFFECLEYFKKIPVLYKCKNELIIQMVDCYAISLELSFYTQNAYFDLAKDILATAEAMVQEQALPSIGLGVLHLEMVYSIAYAHFGLGNYNTSEDWVAIALNQQKNNIREDIICLAQLLHINNHVALGNYQYLNNRLRSVYQFIKKMKKAHAFELVMLQFIKKLINAKSNQEFFDLIKTYKTQFVEIEKDPFVKMIMKNFDVISMLESKLQDRPFAEIAAERRAK